MTSVMSNGLFVMDTINVRMVQMKESFLDKDVIFILILVARVPMEYDILNVKGQASVILQKKKQTVVRRLTSPSLQLENVFGEIVKGVGCVEMEDASPRAR